MATKESPDAWVNDYLENQDAESKPDRIPTIEDLLDIDRKIKEVLSLNPGGKISSRDRRRLRALRYTYEKLSKIYSNLGNRLKNPTVEGGMMIRDPRYRRFKR